MHGNRHPYWQVGGLSELYPVVVRIIPSLFQCFPSTPQSVNPVADSRGCERWSTMIEESGWSSSRRGQLTGRRGGWSVGERIAGSRTARRRLADEKEEEVMVIRVVWGRKAVGRMWMMGKRSKRSVQGGSREERSLGRQDKTRQTGLTVEGEWWKCSTLTTGVAKSGLGLSAGLLQLLDGAGTMAWSWEADGLRRLGVAPSPAGPGHSVLRNRVKKCHEMSSAVRCRCG